MPIEVLVVDNNVPLSGAMAAALEREGMSVAVCDDGLAAEAAMEREMPTVVIMDALLPGITGLSLCRRLRARPQSAETAILLVTAWDTIEDKVAAFEAGCDDFMPKPYDVRELVSRVQALLRRYGPSDDHMLRVGDVELNCRTAEVMVDGRGKLLTPVEFDLLQHFMNHPGEAFSSADLLTHVWGYPPDAGNNDLVRVHIHNLRAKMEDDPSSPKILRTRPRHGYYIESPD
jgi:DNA-binding response OmpR family regulator